MKNIEIKNVNLKLFKFKICLNLKIDQNFKNIRILKKTFKFQKHVQILKIQKKSKLNHLKI